ncbi:MAG: hypothetical protein ACTSP4_16910 [Candidatus Hodarchaeales archaeon]
MKSSRLGKSIIVVFTAVTICFQILTPSLSSPAAVVSSGDIIRMDYTIWNSDLTQYNVTEDVNVFIGNTVPLALREQFIQTSSFFDV